jgi:glycosyltransferase involved in cell wall biosynthesis
VRAFVRAADRTICVSRAELDEIRAVSPSLVQKCALIPYGVELPQPATASERQVARAELGVPDGTVLALWVGALDVPKEPCVAIRAVIEAVRRGGSIRLAIVGDGSLRRDAECAASDNRAVVSFFGHRQDVREFMAAADLFLFSSAREGLPFSLLETMAAGLAPVVAVGVGGIEDVVLDAGRTVPHGDQAALAQALLELALAPELRANLGQAARARVAEHYNAEQMRARTRSVYDRVLERRDGTRALP